MKKVFIQETYDSSAFVSYLKNTLFKDFVLEERSIDLDVGSIFQNARYIGASDSCDASVLEITVAPEDSGKRIQITQSAFRVLRQYGISIRFVKGVCPIFYKTTLFFYNTTWE